MFDYCYIVAVVRAIGVGLKICTFRGFICTHVHVLVAIVELYYVYKEQFSGSQWDFNGKRLHSTLHSHPFSLILLADLFATPFPYLPAEGSLSS